jgi:hypothetical protein
MQMYFGQASVHIIQCSVCFIFFIAMSISFFRTYGFWRQLICLAALMASVTVGQAQNPPRGRLYILHEGGDVGSVGYLDYPCTTYARIDTIAQFGSQLKLHNGRLYALDGNGTIHIYNPTTNQKTGTIEGQSARQIDFYQNQLVVSCYAAPFFKVFDAQSLAPVYSLNTDKVRTACEGILVSGDRAYVAMNNWTNFLDPADSAIAIINLATQDTARILTVGANPNNLLELNGRIYTNLLDYGSTGLRIVAIDPATFNLGTYTVGDVSYGGFTARDTTILFTLVDENFTSKGVFSYDPVAGTHSLLFKKDAYSLHVDAASGEVFYSETDFTTSGSIALDRAGSPYLQANVEIAPRSLVFDGTYYPPFIDLGPDTIACSEASVRVGISCLFTGSTIQWSHGVAGQTELNLNQTGRYIVQVQRPGGPNLIDSIQVSLAPSLTLQGPTEVEVGPGKPSIEVQAIGNGLRYEWSVDFPGQVGTVVPKGDGFSSATVQFAQATEDSVSITASIVGDECGAGKILKIKVKRTTDRLDASTGNRLHLAPNPTTGQLYVRFVQPVSGMLRVLDALGKEVLTQSLDQTTTATVDLTGQPAGVYFVQALGQTAKVVLN